MSYVQLYFTYISRDKTVLLLLRSSYEFMKPKLLMVCETMKGNGKNKLTGKSNHEVQRNKHQTLHVIRLAIPVSGKLAF